MKTVNIPKCNLVIPMAGRGQRFKDAGFENPKPFIDVLGEPMIGKVISNFRKLSLFIENIVLIAQKEHSSYFDSWLAYDEQLFKKIKIVYLDTVTQGAACTVLKAIDYIDNDQPLILANSDQIIDFNPLDFYLSSFIQDKIFPSILVFRESSNDPKWSYAKIYKNTNFISVVAEKNPISEWATCGVYLYSSGKQFINAATEMMMEEDRVNNEFYVCPTFNYIEDNICAYKIKKSEMHGLGTPQDLQVFIEKKQKSNESSSSFL